MACADQFAHRPFCYHINFMVIKVFERRRQKLYIVWPTVILFCVSFSLPADAVTRIMPVGDSITRGWYGSVNRWGYRKPLYDFLIAGDYRYDFVGGLADGNFPDPNHEGHDGWRSDEILNGKTSEPTAGKLADWLVAYRPDVILLHIGTNDISAGNQSASKISAILDEIDDYEADNNTYVTVILARIINRVPYSQATTTYNNAVEAMALGRIAGGDDIIIADMESALNYTTDMADTIHPNGAGYGKMAAVWYNALTRFFNESRGRLDEVNQRLELTTTGKNTEFASFYTANGWGFNTAQNFAVSISFHYSNVSDEQGWMGICISDDSDYVTISAGSDSNASYFYYDTAIDGNVISEKEPRAADDGTLYVSYDSNSSTFYLSHTGFGAGNAHSSARGLWLKPVTASIGGGSAGAYLESGEAYLDSFQINDAVFIGWPPATDCNLDGYIDIYDLEILCENWLGAGSGDTDNNGYVDFIDFARLGLAW
jgi:lysophospholipase L1-like esterase